MDLLTVYPPLHFFCVSTDMVRQAHHKSINPRGFKGAKFTKEHLPVKLVYTEEYEIEHEARMREQQLHGWTRAKKEALIQKFKSSRSLRRSKVQKLPQGILNHLNCPQGILNP